MRVTAGFCLMTKKGLTVLEAVIAALGAESISWVTAGRDDGVQDDHFEAIVALCRTHGIPFSDRRERIARTADYTFAVSWRWLIGYTKGLIVLHDSLLPKYRGFAPLPNALINGERVVGVTALLASDEYDKGPILGQRRIALAYPVKIRDVIDLMAIEYGKLAVDLMTQILAGQTLSGSEQDEGEATYSLWRDEQDYEIQWGEHASYIKRFIDSVGTPYRGASSMLNGGKVRIMDAEPEADVRIENRQPGKVIFIRQGCPVVVCGRGLLRITDLVDDATGCALLPLPRFRSRFA